jgi:ankyrin repeat protein
MMPNRIIYIFISSVFLLSVAASADDNPRDQETLNRSLRQEAIVGVIPRIEKLLKEGADINSQAPHGETALDYAVRFGRHMAAIRLVELGANPDIEDGSGVSPLYRAAGDCNASRVVDAFLKAGADVNHPDLYGRTALMNATHADCVRTVAVILQRRKGIVDIDARDDSLQTASDLARNGLIPQMLEIGRKNQEKAPESETAPTPKLRQSIQN